MGAAYNGDAPEVARILSVPCDIDAHDDHGMTALMYAAMKDHTEVVECLISHQASLDRQSGQRYTALLYAVRGGHTATVHALLRAKADSNIHEQDDIFDTPLTLAAWQGHLPIVRLLVAAGADLNLRGTVWQLPAEAIARRRGHHHVSEYLLYHEPRRSAKE